MTLRKFCELVGIRSKRWNDALTKIVPIEPELPLRPKMGWPMEWTDRGVIRYFDDVKNYPAYGPGIIYAKQISLALGHKTQESVLKYEVYGLPEDWLKEDRYGSFYTDEKKAIKIYNRIKEFDDYGSHISPQR